MPLQKLINEIPANADFNIEIKRKGRRYYCCLEIFYGKESFGADSSSEKIESSLDLLIERVQKQRQQE